MPDMCFILSEGTTKVQCEAEMPLDSTVKEGHDGG